MDREALEQMYPELFQMFAGYFHQHFDTVLEGYDDDKPVVPQVTYAYKKLCSKKDIAVVARELES